MDSGVFGPAYYSQVGELSLTKMRDKPRTSSAGKDSAGCASSPGKLMKPPIG
jgi:hypothetical protein